MTKFTVLVCAAALCLLLAGPAGAAKLFAIDANGDQEQQFGPIDSNGAGPDDLFFSDGDSDSSSSSDSDSDSGGAAVSGVIRALPVFDPPVNRIDLFLTGDVQSCVDFVAGSCSSSTAIDPTGFDILIVDVQVFEGAIDEIGFAVTTTPLLADIAAAGWMLPCDGSGGALAEPSNCRDAAGLQAPSGVSVTPGVDGPGGFDFPPSVVFQFGTTNDGDSDNLEAGETSLRFFAAWADTGPESPLSKINQQVLFMISSGANFNVGPSNIVPEPSSVLLLGLGLAGLVRARRNRSV